MAEPEGVSLDLSKTNTGVCYWEGANPKYTVSVHFRDHDYFGAVLQSFHNFIIEYVNLRELDWVAYEEVRPRNKYHMELHFGMVGELARMCYKEQVPLIGVTSGEAKKFLTGKGRAEKEEMLREAQALYPKLHINNHDEADAVAVGGVAVSRMKL